MKSEAERGMYMVIPEELERMRKMNIMELDREKLAKSEDIVIQTDKCTEERIKSFIKQTGNPFAQNIGEYIVQTGFSEDTEELIDDRMILFIKRKAQIMI